MDNNKLQKLCTKFFAQAWCKAGKTALAAYPAGKRPDKQQRGFGAILMAVLTNEALKDGLPLPFQGALFPEWGNNSYYDTLVIWESKERLFAGGKVDAVVMKEALDAISNGDYDTAYTKISTIWQQLSHQNN